MMRPRYFSLYAGLALLSYEPFGVISTIKDLNSPQKNFSELGPVLTVSRVQKISFEKKKTCSEVFGVFKTLNAGQPWLPGDDKAFQAFEPYSKKDLDAVMECDEFPCDVKLNEREVGEMKSATRLDRQAVFFDLVRARAKNYLEKGERKEYEFPGDPVDPFKLVEVKLKGQGADLRGKESKLFARIIDMKDSRARPIRQIVDERYADGKMDNLALATLWSRDVYTAHYFDSWGEYKGLLCDEKTHDLRLIQIYVLELDLLKKDNLISMISRGAMKKNIREGADRLMDEFVTRLSTQLK